MVSKPLLPLLLSLALAALSSCASIDLPAGTPVKDLVNVTFSAADGSKTLFGYLASPQGAGPFPAVLMIHEWWGLTEEILRKADHLAREGFVVLAVDAYRGRSASTVPRAIALVSSTPKERIAADIDAGWSYLLSLPSVVARRSSSTALVRSRIRQSSATWARAAQCSRSSATRTATSQQPRRLPSVMQ